MEARVRAGCALLLCTACHPERDTTRTLNAGTYRARADILGLGVRYAW